MEILEFTSKVTWEGFIQALGATADHQAVHDGHRIVKGLRQLARKLPCHRYPEANRLMYQLLGTGMSSE